MEQNMTALVTEAEKGSQAAYEALYRETKQMVYFTCFGLLQSEADAADQMQETYVTAFQKLDMLEEPEKFPAWIKRIAINKCKDFLLQKKSWLPLLEEEDIPVEEEDVDFLPEAYITVQSKRRIVQQIMQEELSDIQYRTVLLYYYDELSLAEIAGLMECSEGTVKSRLYTARERVKEGVLKYEKKHEDKLYSIAAFPFFVQLLRREAEELQVPEVPLDLLQGRKSRKPDFEGRENAKQGANRNQKGGRTGMEKQGFFSTTAGKIAVTVLALCIVGGGLAGILIAVSHGGQRTDQEGSSAEGNADIDEREDVSASKDEEFFCQVPFTDADTGEDYLSGHIRSAVSYDYEEDYTLSYLVLDDNHNLYKCKYASDIDDVYEENDAIKWNIELLYENTSLEGIEKYWLMDHYDMNTREKASGADGHEECMVIYGNGYVYRDGEEYNLNAILPIKELGANIGNGELFIVDTSGNLHYWANGKGLDSLGPGSLYPEYQPVGFLNYYEAPVSDELVQGNCMDVESSNVLMSDGRLVDSDSPIIFTEDFRAMIDVDKYTYEERVVMEGVKALYEGNFKMAVEDSEGKIHVGGPYSPTSIGELDQVVDSSYEGEIQGIYVGNLNAILLQTTDAYYYSGYCYDADTEIIPFAPLTILDSAPSPVKEVVDIVSIDNVEILFLLEDGTVWGYIDD
ncbi:MAG: RNA polymerase sigma factor [Bacteroides sp.]|nr:RNA polymerase sigma factor [Bacteroides sp.]MCM1550937.1 RNA polymerase sigma factor [Clostridium sp.]